MNLSVASSPRDPFLAVQTAGLALLALLASLGSGCFDPNHGDDLPAAATGDATDAGGTGDTGAEDADSTSSTTAADAVESSTGGADAGGNEELCADYCGLIDDHCEDELAQYTSDNLCEATCAAMPPGTPGDELGNSVSCRTFHAILAGRTPQTHCQHAGPAGAGTCGANCENFCSLAMNICGGDLAVYASAEECITECDAFLPEPLYAADVPDGDTFACRLRHLTLASAQPEVHCGHIGPVSPVCFDQ